MLEPRNVPIVIFNAGEDHFCTGCFKFNLTVGFVIAEGERTCLLQNSSGGNRQRVGEVSRVRLSSQLRLAIGRNCVTFCSLRQCVVLFFCNPLEFVAPVSSKVEYVVDYTFITGFVL